MGGNSCSRRYLQTRSCGPADVVSRASRCWRSQWLARDTTSAGPQDRDKETSIPINQATFLMSNMVAQAPDNNQGPWAAFEHYLRTLLPTDEIYIVAGGIGAGGTGSNGGTTMTVAQGHVTVPAHTWKVALVIPKDSGDDA